MDTMRKSLFVSGRILILAALLSGCNLGMRESGGAMPPAKPFDPVAANAADRSPVNRPTNRLPELQTTSGNTGADVPTDRKSQILGDYNGNYSLPASATAAIRRSYNTQVEQSIKAGPPKLMLNADGTFSFENLNLTITGRYQIFETLIECVPERFNGMMADEFQQKGYTDPSGKVVKLTGDNAIPTSLPLEILGDGSLKYAPPTGAIITFIKPVK